MSAAAITMPRHLRVGPRPVRFAKNAVTKDRFREFPAAISAGALFM